MKKLFYIIAVYIVLSFQAQKKKRKKENSFKHFKTTIHNTTIPFYTQPSICIIPPTLSRESWVPPPTMFQNPQTPEGSLFPIKNEWIILWNYWFCQYDRTYCSCFYWEYLFRNMVQRFPIFCIFWCIFALFCLVLPFSEIISFACLLSYHTIYIKGRIQALFEIGNRLKIGAQILIDQLKI